LTSQHRIIPKDQQMTSIVLITHHALSASDAQDLAAMSPSSPESTTFHVAVPEKASSASINALIDDWELDVASGRGSGAANHPELQESPEAVAAHEARQVLDSSLAALREVGAVAEGEVTPAHPLDSIGDMIAHHQPDEVVVMIRHHKLNELTSRDLAAKIRRKFGVASLRVKAH
jgi:hypothetical protein